MKFFNESAGLPTDPQVSQLLMPSKSVVYSQLIPRGTRKFTIKLDTAAAFNIKFSKTAGDITNPISLLANQTWQEDGTLVNQDIYINIQAPSNDSVNAQFSFWK